MRETYLEVFLVSPLYIKYCLNLHDHGKVCMVRSVLPGPEANPEDFIIFIIIIIIIIIIV
jgi:hypothetical protein